MFRIVAALAGFMLASACVAPSSPPPPQPSGPAQPSGSFRAAPTMRGFGIDTVVGQTAPALLRRFGEARIDLVEGDARKLQFASQRCVLDIFLYPRERGAEPTASHVEARERGSATDVDRAACIAEVERSRREP